MKAGERRSTFTRTPPVGCNRQLREDEAKPKDYVCVFCKFCNVQYLRTACIPRGQDKSSAGALAAERRWPAHPSPRDRVHRCGAARSSTPRRTSCNTRMHASESRARPECLSCAALRQQQKHHLPEHGTVFLRHTPTHVRLCVPGWPPTLSLCRIQGWCGALHSF